MKQGRASPNGPAGAMRQPVPHAISIDKVANIGLQIVRTSPSSKPLYIGKGYKAPANVSCNCSNKGSQGKY